MYKEREKKKDQPIMYGKFVQTQETGERLRSMTLLHQSKRQGVQKSNQIAQSCVTFMGGSEKRPLHLIEPEKNQKYERFDHF